MEIKQAQVKGEVGTGFEKRGDKGPFECGNCHYFKNGSCGQETMMERSRLPKTENGRPIVSAEDCCEYIERIGKKKAGHWLAKRG